MPKNHPRSNRWAVDFDYVRQLSPEEQRWLGEFADAYYKADPSAMRSRAWTVEEKREVYRRKNAANRDLYVLDEVVPVEYEYKGVVHMNPFDRRAAPRDPQDWTPTPEYLASDEYKAALEEYRKTLGAWDGRKPPKPNKHSVARRKLEEIVEDHTDE